MKTYQSVCRRSKRAGAKPVLFGGGNGIYKEEKFKYPHDITSIRRVFAEKSQKKAKQAF